MAERKIRKRPMQEVQGIPMVHRGQLAWIGSILHQKGDPDRRPLAYLKRYSRSTGCGSFQIVPNNSMAVRDIEHCIDRAARTDGPLVLGTHRWSWQKYHRKALDDSRELSLHYIWEGDGYQVRDGWPCKQEPGTQDSPIRPTKDFPELCELGCDGVPQEWGNVFGEVREYEYIIPDTSCDLFGELSTGGDTTE